MSRLITRLDFGFLNEFEGRLEMTWQAPAFMSLAQGANELRRGHSGLLLATTAGIKLVRSALLLARSLRAEAQVAFLFSQL